MVMEKKYTIERIIGESVIYDKNTSFLIASHMNEIYENLKVIRDSNEMSDFLNDENDATRSEFVGLLLRIMRNKSSIERVRYLDDKGNESVRVAYEGDLIVSSLAQTDPSKDSPEFERTVDAAFDDILISPLELKFKDGELAQPQKPILRFSTPVNDNKGDLKGVLIVYYKADYFLDMFLVHNEFERVQSSKVYVVNKTGGFIMHPDEKMNFSFMFDDMKSMSMQKENAELWSIIKNNSQGHVELKNQLITFYDVLQDVKEANELYTEKWILVHEIDISNLLSVESVIRNLILSRNVLVFVMIFVLSYILSLTSEKLRSRDYQLEITRKIAETTNDAVLITDEESRITYVNQAYEEITGYLSSQVIGKKPGELNSGRQDEAFYREMWQDIKVKGNWEGMLWDRKRDGLLYLKKLRIIAIKDKTMTYVRNYIGIFSDLSVNKRKENYNQVLDYSQGEMRLPNEGMMIELLKKNVIEGNFSFMVLSVVIENYNQLRTTFRDTEFNSAETFVSLVKKVLGENDFVARTERNLYSIIIEIKDHQSSSQEVVQRIYNELTKVMTVNDQNIFLKVRIGVSYWHRDAEDLKELILNSIIALEWTSLHPENEIAFFSPEMIEQMNRENEIEGALRTAIENEEFFLVYQPQIDIKTNEVVGMEALLRWQNQHLGFVSPDRFIPIAEKSRLIISIGNWVIRKVCEDIEYLNRTFIGLNETIRCAVNISTVQMEETGFLEKLYDTIGQYDVGHNQLEIEITESMLLSNEMKNIRNIERIRNSGIKIAIDDFGTGYSSMSYLNRLPIDKIKVDRTFIKNYPDHDDGKLAGILVNMAKSLGIEVLMEGAETVEQVDYLKRIGCNYIQGYYYSKPLILKDFLGFLKLRNQRHDKVIDDL
jgi:PAS domain S-box-containing protein